jgi:pantetheine-phosphate adenylyltransferase
LTIAIYPGSFDPVTNGHLDIAQRAAAIFEELIIAVYDRPLKDLLFTTEEMWEKAIDDLPNIQVKPYPGLTVDFARQVGAKVIVRGLRASADFEYEFDMAHMNKSLAPELEMVCMVAKLEYLFISSSRLKEVAALGVDISHLVPKHVAVAMREKLRHIQGGLE